MTTGTMGKLVIDGRQVGGFKDWQIDVFIRKGKAITRIFAESYWMFERIKTAEATFYFSSNDALLIANQFPVTLELPESYALNKLIKTPLKMVLCAS